MRFTSRIGREPRIDDKNYDEAKHWPDWKAGEHDLIGYMLTKADAKYMNDSKREQLEKFEEDNAIFE